jgi:copper transport protein
LHGADSNTPHMRRLLHLLMFVLVFGAGLGSYVPAASAHNSLASSTPADGAALESAPSALSMVFAKSVPLETMSLEMIDATGARSDINGLTHGPLGDTEVIAVLPALAAGDATFRWKLVGSDGHAITGRLSFSVAAAPVAAPQATVAPAPAPAPAPVAVETTTVPVAPPAVAGDQVLATPTLAPAPVVDASGDVGADGFSDSYVTPDAIRWLMRLIAYTAMTVIAGVIITAAFVWPAAWGNPALRRLVTHAHWVVAATAMIQLLIIGSDISGSAPWSLSGLGGAFETDAGKAFVLRMLLIGGLWAVLFIARFADEQQRWLAVSIVGVLAMATWAFAGHSKSMRWPLIGIPIDVAHFAAAGAWIGGLTIIGLVAIREASNEDLVGIVPRFGQVAATSVAVLVGTGVIQTFRLLGSPWRVFEVNHGRWLIVKLVVLGLMLWVADVNRKRVARRFAATTQITERATDMLRRAMTTELVVGALIIAITAIMVVSPPATAQDEVGGAGQSSSADEVLVTTTTVAGSTPLLPPVVVVQVTTPQPVTCTVSASLQVGATGDAVLCLQQALAVVGLYQGTPTGTFDEATDAAVKAFQTANALLADGIVGPVTGQKLGIWAGE